MGAGSSSENRGGQLVGVSILFLVLSWISVVLRCVVRIGITKKGLQLDDWLMVIAILTFSVTTGFIFAGVHYGLGAHNASLTTANQNQGLKYQALATLIYIADMAFVKSSIAVFLLRIATVKSVYTYILYTSLVILILWSAGVFFFALFECHPVAFQFDPTIVGGTCVSNDKIVAAAYALSVLSVLSDWLYAILPIPLIWNLQMSIQAKITVAAILSLGIFASVATLIRIKFLVELESSNDILYGSTDAMIWTLVEPGLGMTAASIVTLRPLLRALKIKGFGGGSSRTRQMGREGTNGFVVNIQGGYSRAEELVELSVSRPQKGSAVVNDGYSENDSEDFILQGHATPSTVTTKISARTVDIALK